jgi:hypothetical protein
MKMGFAACTGVAPKKTTFVFEPRCSRLRNADTGGYVKWTWGQSAIRSGDPTHRILLDPT